MKNSIVIILLLISIIVSPLQAQKNAGSTSGKYLLAFTPETKDIEKRVKQNNAERSAEVYEDRIYQELLKKYGEKQQDNVSFTVELGTFERASDFHAEKYKDLGTIVSYVNENGYTTYSIGSYKKLLDAEIFKYKLNSKENAPKGWQNPALIVTVNDKGNHKLIQQYYYDEYTRKNYVAPSQANVIKAGTNHMLSSLTGEGELEIEGISYQLEIGAYENPAGFDMQKWSKYGKVESKKYSDGKFHYTLGPYKTVNEAEVFRGRLTEIDHEAAKAFITVVYFGTPKTMEEMEKTKKTEMYKKAEANALAKAKFSKTEIAQTDTLKDKTYKETATNIIEKNWCDPNAPREFSYFIGKDLNDKEIYDKLISMAGNSCAEGLIFKVQIGAYRKPENFKHQHLNSLEPPKALVLPYPDGVTRFTMRDFKTLKEAESFRQEVIRLGTEDAWITSFYEGNRLLLQELIAHNFFCSGIN